MWLHKHHLWFCKPVWLLQTHTTLWFKFSDLLFRISSVPTQVFSNLFPCSAPVIFPLKVQSPESGTVLQIWPHQSSRSRSCKDLTCQMQPKIVSALQTAGSHTPSQGVSLFFPSHPWSPSVPCCLPLNFSPVEAHLVLIASLLTSPD